MERRAKVCYPVEVTVRSRARDRKDCGYVTGQTINLSSRGVLVATRDAGHVHERSKVELKIHWACPLSGTIPLNLVAIGTVVRCGHSSFAVTLKRHEFRIVGKAAPLFGRAMPPRDGWMIPIRFPNFSVPRFLRVKSSCAKAGNAIIVNRIIP